MTEAKFHISFFFHQKYPFSKLFSRIIFKSSFAFRFFEKLEKFKIQPQACLPPPPQETRENRAFSAGSYATMEIVPVLPFGSYVHHSFLYLEVGWKFVFFSLLLDLLKTLTLKGSKSK